MGDEPFEWREVPCDGNGGTDGGADNGDGNGGADNVDGNGGADNGDGNSDDRKAFQFTFTLKGYVNADAAAVQKAKELADNAEKQNELFDKVKVSYPELRSFNIQR